MAPLAQLLQKTSTPPSPSPAQRYRPPGCTSRYAKSRSSRTPRTSTGGPCLGARGKQAQLAQANGSKFNLLLMLVAQMSTYPRAIATHYCSWGSRNFKLTHGALTNCFRGPWGSGCGRPPSSSKMFLCTFASPSDPTSQLWSFFLPKRDEMIN